MRRMFIFFLVGAWVAFIAIEGHGIEGAKLWNNLCSSCHNSRSAPDAGWIAARYATIDDFVEGVKKQGKECMNIVKKDEPSMRKIAREIGIKEAQKK